ncbi:bifunctional metallophosphatase/5'-nucleotidase [Novosphingobium sp.]|uniref:bifunctional metallophosphatase/5'-nucleotidase n=1 Tax=Novosphingobium sp. TaxID=1874826 RepID=UPI00286D2CBE|nr:bifunctional metallophosphatase/5'-nucleotidase [Novosphingobium sp.]
MTNRLLLARVALPLMVACAGPAALQSAALAPRTVTVGILAINDFHGAIEPPKQSVIAPDGKGGSAQVPAGGAAWLASAVRILRGQYANSATVTAGDLISASQLASSIYLDEPTIGVANRIGIDFSAVGNHEFDRGRQELLRMQRGGCKQYTPRKPCQVERFTGARFKFLAASTITENGKPLFPAFGIKSYGQGARKVTVGFIGLTLKGTTDLVSPGGIKGLVFRDEARTINALVPQLKAKGADAVVVLIHQGGQQDKPTDPNSCSGFSGEIAPILDQLDPRVDVVVSGHTHRAYVCDYGQINPAHPVLLTSAGNYGTMLTDIALEIDPVTNKVVAKRARNLIVQSQAYVGSRGPIPLSPYYPVYAPDKAVAAYVQLYVDAAKAFAQRPAGHLAAPAAGAALGQLIADAQLDATRAAGAQIALMNPFGVRAPIVPATDGSVKFADIYAAQPFANTLVTQSFSGAELKAALEQGFDENGPYQALIPSAGLTYGYDMSRPAGDRVVDLRFNGQPIDPAATYRVTTNSFLAQGGDSFTLLARQKDGVIGVSDLDALEAWLKGADLRAVPEAVRAVEVKP